MENPRHEILYGISKIPNSCHKKLLRKFARHGTQHNGKGISSKNGYYPHLNFEGCPHPPEAVLPEQVTKKYDDRVIAVAVAVAVSVGGGAS